MFELSSLQSVAEAYLEMLSEAQADSPQRLTHIHHAEDRPLLHGAAGFEHAHGALMQAHEHMKAGKHNTNLTMKYDGSPSLVFGHHPQTNKFFVATKSAWNKTPKIAHTPAEVKHHYGHAPGLVHKLNKALEHLPKVTPKHGVYQGDVLHTRNDHEHHKDGSVSFKPNTITYTAHGDEAAKVKKSHVGIVVHQQYHEHPKHPGDLMHMTASPHPDTKNFKSHPDVHFKTAEHDTSKIDYPKKDQATFTNHLAAAKAIHDKHKGKMYNATAKHAGPAGHLSTYINQTVRSGEKPSAQGFHKHIMKHYEGAASKMKTEKGIAKKREFGLQHGEHILKHEKHYSNLLNMHHHLQQAKNVLVHNLEKHEGGLTHHIDGKKSKPEGFVINHKHNGHEEPTKLVNRSEFARANLLRNRD
jgi:hypothetical protein